jgi:hypothetical protein
VTLQLVGTGGTGKPKPEPPGSTERRLAPGAPLSPGTVPLELSQLLRSGEALVWWDYKDRVNWRPVGWTFGACALVLAGVSLFAPELWAQPLSSLWKAIAAVLSPAFLVFLRERLSLRHLAVTDTSVIELSPRGRADRIAFRNVGRVRRDLLTGGILLDGKKHRVRIPPSLMDTARDAIASQTRDTLKGSPEQPDDPLGWLP